MRHISDVLTQAFKDKEIGLSADGMTLKGQLSFEDELDD